jgi:drug/metabolite transporter (DMT)-like permease
MSRVGLAYLLAAAFFFSLMTVCVKLSGRHGLPAEQIIFARAVVGLVLSIVAARVEGVSLRGVARGRLVLRGLLGSCGLYCFFTAITLLPLAEVTTIHYTNPILTALLAAVLLHEGLGWRLGAALVVSLSGVLVVARPSFLFGDASALDPAAVGIALLGAMFSAGAYVTVRRLRQTDHPSVVVFYFPLVATPLFLPLAARVWVWTDLVGWVLLFSVGVVTQIAQVCLTRGLHLVPAGRGTAVGYVQIAFAMIWSALLFGESLDVTGVLGAALVVGGTLIVALDPSSTTPPDALTTVPDREPDAPAVTP